MFKKILLATDGSELSDKAIRSTVEFAKENGSKIIGLSVATIYPYFPVSPEGISSQFISKINNAAHKHVHKISVLASAAGVDVEVHVVRGNNPSEEIVKAATHHHCDAIFMASHGYKGVDRFLLGSEAQKVLALSKLPVTIFK